MWLVNEGAVTAYEGDLDDYRRFLLSGDDDPKPKAETSKPAPRRAPRDELLSLRSQVRRAEERVRHFQTQIQTRPPDTPRPPHARRRCSALL